MAFQMLTRALHFAKSSQRKEWSCSLGQESQARKYTVQIHRASGACCMSLRIMQQVFKYLMRRAGEERCREVVEELLRLAGNRSAAGYTPSLSCAEGDLKSCKLSGQSALSPDRDRSLNTFKRGGEHRVALIILVRRQRLILGQMSSCQLQLPGTSSPPDSLCLTWHFRDILHPVTERPPQSGLHWSVALMSSRGRHSHHCCTYTQRLYMRWLLSSRCVTE